MINQSKQPIGIFDSGIGGTSIWKEIEKLLPNEGTIYLSDSKNAPYGQKSRETIIRLSAKNTELLLEKGCKLIVVACNTATTNAINYLRKTYNIPFIGIEPAIKPASLRTQTNTIGILATKGTLNSELFEKTSAKIDKKITIVEQIGEGLVELIEDGKVNSEEMNSLLQKYLIPMLKQDVDCLVLGCTHYPYLIPQIRKIVGNKMQIIDSSKAIAKQTKTVLANKKLLNTSSKKGASIFFSNRKKNVLESVLRDQKEILIHALNF